MLCYLDQHGAFPVSVSFPSVLAAVSLSTASITEAEERRRHITELIARKQAGDELGIAAPDGVLNAFIEERLEHWKDADPTDSYDRAAMQRETERVLQAVLSEETIVASR
jgi:predicted nucleotidyltransferase